MKALIFGSTGFIGKHLTARLLKEGYKVIGISSRKHREDKEKESYRHITLDITDISQFKKLPRDYINMFILSAYVPPSPTSPPKKGVPEDLLRCFKVNMLGLRNILEYARDIHANFIVYSSSASVYGASKDLPLFEDTSVPNPTSFYSISKLAGEHILKHYESIYEIPAAILRYSSVFGPGMTQDTVLPFFLEKALNNNDITIFGEGEKSRDYVFVDDVVASNIRALSAKRSGIFNIGSGVETSMQQLAEKIIKITNSRSCIVRSFLKEETSRMYLDISKARKEIDYEPMFSLEAGLRQCIIQP